VYEAVVFPAPLHPQNMKSCFSSLISTNVAAKIMQGYLIKKRLLDFFRHSLLQAITNLKGVVFAVELHYLCDSICFLQGCFKRLI